MEYTIIMNGRSYELPKKTISIMEELDTVLKVDTIKGLTVTQKFEKLHNFIKLLIGEENAKEAFGSSDIRQIDLSELTLAVKKVNEAYLQPIEDYENRRNFDMLNNLPIDKIIALGNAAQTMTSMPLHK